ncbi:hypothetical protein JXA40_12740 [bacterium]|nr:hypothetical protein [candidate division CSSED10-310 bacterium]
MNYRKAGAFAFCALIVLLSISVYAAENPAFPWQVGETIKYEMTDEDGTYHEESVLKKVKKSGDHLLHSFDLEQHDSDGALYGKFVVDENGVFIKSWGRMKPNKYDLDIKYSSKRKADRIEGNIEFTVGRETARPMQYIALESISDDTWVLNPSPLLLAIYISKMPLELEYSRIVPIAFLSFFPDEDTKVYQCPMAVTGHKEIDFNGVTISVFTATFDIPRNMVSDSESDEFTKVDLIISKKDKILLSADVRTGTMSIRYVK